MAKPNTPKQPGKTPAGARKGQPAPPQNPSRKERVSSLFSSSSTAPQARKRRVSRRERDARRQKRLYIALAAAATAIVLMVAGMSLYQYFLKPNQTLASVAGEDISRRDYWKYREHTLINQALQYQQFAQFVQGQQQQQYLALAQQAQAQLEDVWGSSSVDDATLGRMIDDKVYLESLDSLGLTISDEDLDAWVDQQFAAQNAPISSPTPTQTLIPERAEWATQTAVALTVAAGTPIAIGSPEAVASPQALLSSPQPASPSPIPGTPPAGTAVSGSPVPVTSPRTGATVTPTPTIGPDQARATSEANQENYADGVLDDAHMSMNDYKRLIAKPAMARELVSSFFTNEIGQSAEQVHAAHILVGTRELADQLYGLILENPDDFAAIAEESSVDEGTAANGGDLGWFPRGIMVPQFEEIAFSLAEGDISEPFQTEFGWHIVRVLEKDDNRALTDTQIEQASQSLAERWLNEQKATLDISTPIKPTPTPSLSQFVPPADAPPAPEPTAIGSPVPLPPATPQASPMASPVTSPSASPEPSNG